MTEQDAVIQSFGALMGEDPDVGKGFLLASVYCRAIQTGMTPRAVLDDLWKAMPSTESWSPLRTALLEVIDGD